MKEKFTHWLIIFLILVSAVSAFYIWSFSRSRGLDFQLEAPDQILSGVPFDLKVNFSNNSGAVLNDARLTLILPEGAAFFGSPISKTIENKNLGNVGDGSLIQEHYTIIVSPSESVSKEFKATINYAPATLGARFEKTETLSLPVKSSGVEVLLSGTEKAVSGEAMELNLLYQNISESDFSDLELKLEYPPSFSFTESSLKPDSGDNFWSLGSLRKNSEGKLTIKGNLLGSAGDKFEFRAFLYRRSGSESYLVSQTVFPVILAASPLSLSISVNNSADYIARAGDTLNYAISYINGTNVPLREVVVRAQLAGEMFDLSSVQMPGFFRASDNTLIWNSQNTPNLALLSPGSAGIVTFSVKVKNNYPIRRFSDKNFILYIIGEIESPTPANSDSLGRLFTKTRLETKVAGNLTVDAKAYFRDAESGILNQGTLPPKVGQITNFTVHWQIKNFGSDVSNVEVRGKLGNNVRMVGEPKSNSGSLPRLETINNEVVWNIDKIQANQGVISNPTEAIFQVEATPEASQIGAYLPLIGPTMIRANDDFTGQELLGNDVGITTALPDDPTVGQQGGVVQP